MRVQQQRRIPFTVIGGFLGAGKTTLLNRVLQNTRGTRYAVLVNDFGGLNIDSRLIERHGGETVALTNGCICCSIGDSLMDTLLQLLGRPHLFDHVLVEASGVGNPRRIADIAVIDPALPPEGIIVLVDAARVKHHAKDRYVGDTVLQQIRAADILVLNKCDLVEDGERRELARWLGELNPKARCLPVVRADAPCEVLLGISPRDWNGQSSPAQDSPDEALRFRRAMIELLPLVDKQQLEDGLAALPASVLRVKGFVRFSTTPAQLDLLQMVGGRWTFLPFAGEAGTNQVGRLVVIGTPEMPAGEVISNLFDFTGQTAG